MGTRMNIQNNIRKIKNLNHLSNLCARVQEMTWGDQDPKSLTYYKGSTKFSYVNNDKDEATKLPHDCFRITLLIELKETMPTSEMDLFLDAFQKLIQTTDDQNPSLVLQLKCKSLETCSEVKNRTMTATTEFKTTMIFDAVIQTFKS